MPPQSLVSKGIPVMNEEELIDFLKRNLKIQVEEGIIMSPYDTGTRLRFLLKLGDETISEDYIDVQTED